jgi:hypothetical protein
VAIVEACFSNFFDHRGASMNYCREIVAKVVAVEAAALKESMAGRPCQTKGWPFYKRDDVKLANNVDWFLSRLQTTL